MKVTHPRCGKGWSGFERQHCEVCCQTFNSTAAGDMHRVGPFMPRSARRCLTPDEMTAKGMFERDGIWYGQARSTDSDPDLPQMTAEQPSPCGPVTPRESRP